MSTNEAGPAPAANPAPVSKPAPAPISGRLLAAGQAICLGLAVLTLVGCLIVVTGFLINAPALRNPVAAPDDPARSIYHSTTESQRHQSAVEQRTATLQSLGLMVGVALAFVGLGLLLGAARADGPEEPVQARLARAVPGTVALVCSAAVMIFAGPASAPAGPAQNAPATPYGVPSVGFAYAPPG